MHSEVAWVLESSRLQVQPQIILDPDYLPDYLSVSYDYGLQQPDVCLESYVKSTKHFAQDLLISTAYHCFLENIYQSYFKTL